jgi:capsular exopolysaccharide synthesis family protein
VEDLLKLAESIRRWKWLVIGVGVIAMLVALVLTLGKDSTYTATSTVSVGAASQSQSRAPEQDAIVARGYVEGLINTAAYQEKMFADADIPDSVDITASNLVGGPLIAIDATSTDQAQAIAAAKAAARFFVNDTRQRLIVSLDESLEPLREQLQNVAGQIPGIQAQLDAGGLSASQVTELRGQLESLTAERDALRTDLEESVSFAENPNLVSLVNEPEVATANSTAVISNAILGLLGGLVLGAAIALVLGALELKITSPSVVRSKLGLPTLASISGVDQQRRQEDLKGLASGMALMASGVTSVAVTSPGVGEGKTLVASNLARYRAALGDRVILIDANLRADSLNGHHRESLGLAKLLASGDDVHVPDVLIDSGLANLKILPAGAPEEDPYALVTGERISRVLEHAAPFADLLVIDTAAVLNAPESQVICSMADRTILVLDSASTQTTAAVEARDVLERVHARVLGVVLTRVVKRGASLRRPPQGGGGGGNGRRPEQSAARETTRRS